jgi:hypothetical protein
MTTSAKQGSNNLGISGKSINRREFSRVAAVSDDVMTKFQKYALTRKAGSILYDGAKLAHEQHRTCWCHRGVASAADSVAVYRQTEGTSARLHGVTTCKSVWTCPVCSYKICAVRQAELAEGMKNWVEQGGYVFLMTLTFPHELEQRLAELLPAFTRAKAFFKNSKTYKRILAKGVRKGSVSSLEVTLGEHGWHPHQHDLVFATPDAYGATVEHERGKLSSRLIDDLKEAWYMALRKSGLCEQNQLSDVLKHGLDVRGGQYAAEYIAKFGRDQKWGMSRELTMHAAKVGSDSKGAHPFQLLAWAEDGDGLAIDQFREYAEAFEGKRMLSWSRGLKKELTGQEETSDEEAADTELPAEEVIGRIDSADLAVLQSRHLLGEFLGYVAQYCTNPDTAQDDIDAYISNARELERTGQGTIKRKMHSRGFMHVDAEKQDQK